MRYDKVNETIYNTLLKTCTTYRTSVICLKLYVCIYPVTRHVMRLHFFKIAGVKILV